MVRSNAERQKAWRDRRNDLARRGITPEDMQRAIRLTWERIREDSPDLPEWDAYLERLRTKTGLRNWRSDIDIAVWKIEDDEDQERFGADAELIRKARAILDAILSPHAIADENAGDV